MAADECGLVPMLFTGPAVGRRRVSQHPHTRASTVRTLFTPQTDRQFLSRNLKSSQAARRRANKQRRRQPARGHIMAASRGGGAERRVAHGGEAACERAERSRARQPAPGRAPRRQPRCRPRDAGRGLGAWRERACSSLGRYLRTEASRSPPRPLRTGARRGGHARQGRPLLPTEAEVGAEERGKLTWC